MERALYIEPILVSQSPIQRASAVLPFIIRAAADIFVSSLYPYKLHELDSC